ncbi:MAG: hypothetical protein RI907_2220 [Pseudomonadota bacterium]|jgi:uncharacterized membrane protein
MSAWTQLQRWTRHLWLDDSDSRRLLPTEACARLEAAVRASEARHLGELRVCVEASLPWAALRAGLDAHQRAIDLFGQLRVWDTPHNNGVLIYLLLADRRIEILADRGLHSLADPKLWTQLAQDIGQAMASGQVEAGLQQALTQVSAALVAHHPAPASTTKRNDLPDSIILM